MRALPGLLGERAPTPRLLFLLQCLLAAARPSSADGSAPDSPLTSPPLKEEMMANNFSLESHNVSLTDLLRLRMAPQKTDT
uniref:Uncharacterized protein n=1 Tax=Nomascus leucogenys TaxID=61853 RepID=A0A2I3GAB6_NOMLE